jgi:hypothetical protein
VGHTLWEAYLRLEKVEHTAQITLAAQQLGRVQTLSSEAVQKLAAKRRELLQREGRDLCEGCSICLLGDDYVPAAGSLDDETAVRQITQAVINNMEKELFKR